MSLISSCFLCEVECGEKCPNCEYVFFCSDEHLQIHKSNKKCLPWTVKFQEGVGRTLVASRDILPFELVMTDLPLVTVQDLSDLCVHCKEVVPTVFSTCKCGFKQCQVNCAKKYRHVEECEFLCKVRKIIPDTAPSNLFSTILEISRLM